MPAAGARPPDRPSSGEEALARAVETAPSALPARRRPVAVAGRSTEAQGGSGLEAGAELDDGSLSAGLKRI